MGVNGVLAIGVPHPFFAKNPAQKNKFLDRVAVIEYGGI
jgi:hypothetical protein